MKLPELPYPDEDICQVVVERSLPPGDEVWHLAVVGDPSVDGGFCRRRIVRDHLDRSTAVTVAIALRKRIRTVRRLLGRGVEALAV
ncbi:MAG: hypothetical protein JSS14_21755 [Proteobacteria bacterium]|nr:hypothetical protein [Pseudomonadota bacterium]